MNFKTGSYAHFFVGGRGGCWSKLGPENLHHGATMVHHDATMVHHGGTSVHDGGTMVHDGGTREHQNFNPS